MTDSFESSYRMCAPCHEIFRIGEQNEHGYHTCPACGEKEDIFPAWTHRCHCTECTEDDTYACEHCGRRTPWCYGGIDEHPDCCDDCWNIREQPYAVQALLNTPARTTAGFYQDLLKIEFDGPEGLYDIGLGRGSFSCADLRLVVRRNGSTYHLAEKNAGACVYDSISAFAYPLKPGDTIILQYRADFTTVAPKDSWGPSSIGRRLVTAYAHEAELIVGSEGNDVF